MRAKPGEPDWAIFRLLGKRLFSILFSFGRFLIADGAQILGYELFSAEKVVY
jgi:hypothetical protein